MRQLARWLGVVALLGPLLLVGCSPADAGRRSAPLIAGGSPTVVSSRSVAASSAVTPVSATTMSDGVGDQLPAPAAALLPPEATILAVRRVALDVRASPEWVVAYRQPAPAEPAGRQLPPSVNLAVIAQIPVGWSIVKAVDQGYAVAPRLTVVRVGGRPAAALTYGTGAHAAGLLVLRFDGTLDVAVVFDATSDAGLTLQTLDSAGTPQVVREWSPYCGSFAASPNLTIVYAWRNGAYAEATAAFPSVIAKDRAAFTAALTRPGAHWTAAGLACLHASLAFLATEAGDAAAAQREAAAARQADPGYDVTRIPALARG